MLTYSLVAGALLGAALLAAGLSIGWWLGRRAARSGAAERLQRRQLRHVLGNLAQWTAQLARDVTQHHDRLKRFSDQLRVIRESGSTQQDTGTVDLLAQLLAASDQLEKRLDDAESMLQRQAQEVAAYLSEARTDGLTGLPDRRAFDEELDGRLADAQQTGLPLSVLLADVDHFKRLNDQYGHLAGDAVLSEVARALAGTMRQGDFVARFGGDEFAIILPSTATPEAAQLAQQARRAVQDAVLLFGGQQLRATVSLGLAQAAGSEGAAALVHRADTALYAAKSAGRNAVFAHDGNEPKPAESPAKHETGQASGLLAAPERDGPSQSQQRTALKMGPPPA